MKRNIFLAMVFIAIFSSTLYAQKSNKPYIFVSNYSERVVVDCGEKIIDVDLFGTHKLIEFTDEETVPIKQMQIIHMKGGEVTIEMISHDCVFVDLPR